MWLCVRAHTLECMAWCSEKQNRFEWGLGLKVILIPKQMRGGTEREGITEGEREMAGRCVCVE